MAKPPFARAEDVFTLGGKATPHNDPYQRFRTYMTFWLVTLLALMAILSPMLWLRPSPRDKRLITLRRHASQAGIAVKLTEPPLYNPPGGLISYRYAYAPQCPGPHFLLVRDAYASAALKPAYNGWRWRIEPLRPLSDEAGRRLEEALEQLPGDVLVLESTRMALSFWWGESLSVEQFSQPTKALTALREALGRLP